MKKLGLWFLLNSKRLAKKPSFLLILLLMPCLLLGYRILLQDEEETIRAGLYLEDETDILQVQAAEALLASEDLIDFYLCESKDALLLDVAAGKAECGYVFSPGLWERMLQKDWEGSVTVFVSENSVFSSLINEVVYVELFRTFAADAAFSYITVTNDLPKEALPEAERLFRERYQEYAAANGFFSFEFLQHDNESGWGGADAVEVDSFRKPIRGSIAVFVFVAAMAGAVFWYEDEANGVYRTLSYTLRPYLNACAVLLPAALCGVVGLLCLFVSGVARSWWQEVLCMAVYVCLVAGFCNLLRSLIGRAGTLCPFLPILTIASFVCAPVVMDLAVQMPVLGYVRPFLVVHYYLLATEQFAAFFLMAGLAVLLFAASVGMDYRKNR